ncbi:MAG: hypothetical protein J0L57_13590 [Burkholderiales bacterium]|nr:hypothetical protein [Burkholderiales bacterium]
MKPVLYAASDGCPAFAHLIGVVGTIECGACFPTHLGKLPHEQRDVVARFQKLLLHQLRSELRCFDWTLEYRPSSRRRDSIDIFGRGSESVIAIELDKPRADQVAKKFVARMAALPADVPVWFASVCYPGTERMNKNECIKYFDYCNALSQRLGGHYAGFIIQ